jgi:hypothetical protein
MAAIVCRVIVAFALLLLAMPAWAQTAASSALQGFGIVLVLGDVQEGTTADNIPPGARAALADLKDFLPYRSYRVLDTAWLLASATNRQAVTSRLRGPDEQEYEVVLDRLPVPPSSLQIRFAMREPGGYTAQRADGEAAIRAELQQMMAMRGTLETQQKRAEAAQNRSEVDVIRQKLNDMEVHSEALRQQIRSSFGNSALIDTTFTMSLGETVVVGTSRMRGGNKALIVLLTAATRVTKPRE